MLYILSDRAGLYTEPTWAFTWPAVTYREISMKYNSGQIFKPSVICNTCLWMRSYVAGKAIDYLFEILIKDRKMNILLMCMERSICEAFPLILSEKSTFFQVNMIHCITRASAIHFLPLFWWLLTLPETSTDTDSNLKLNVKFLLIRTVLYGNRNYKCLLKKVSG